MSLLNMGTQLLVYMSLSFQESKQLAKPRPKYLSTSCPIKTHVPYQLEIPKSLGGWKLTMCHQSGGLVTKNPGQICLEVPGTPFGWGASVMVCGSVRPQNKICCKTRGDFISHHKEMLYRKNGHKIFIQSKENNLEGRNKGREWGREERERQDLGRKHLTMKWTTYYFRGKEMSCWQKKVQEPLGAQNPPAPSHTIQVSEGKSALCVRTSQQWKCSRMVKTLR